jgi:16S rRNA (guanine527-N7)-methyltransferase
MGEEEAQVWLQHELDVSRETLEKLDALVHFLCQENERQNLVSRSSLAEAWTRHILDSAQLIRHAPAGAGRWLDLGTGAGFPGLIVTLLYSARVTMVEERKLRVGFLEQACEMLGIADKAEVVALKAERFKAPPFDVISARAFAPLERLFGLAEHLATPATRWILPKGKNAKSELEAATASWQGEFRLEPSLTDPDAQIIVAEQVKRRGKGKRAR